MKLKLREMTEVLEFDGLKLKKTEFRFISNKEINKFFNESLIESPLKFVRLNNQMFLEKMHVSLSWMQISKILSFALFIPAIAGILYNAPQWFGISMVCISVFFFLRSKWLSKRLID